MAKFVARHGFLNTTKGLIKVEGDTWHKKAVVKGARVIIGDDQTLEDILGPNGDQETASLLKTLGLHSTGHLVEDTTKNEVTIKRIDSEVAREKQDREAARAAVASGSNVEVVKTVLAVLKQAGIDPDALAKAEASLPNQPAGAPKTPVPQRRA